MESYLPPQELQYSVLQYVFEVLNMNKKMQVAISSD